MNARNPKSVVVDYWPGLKFPYLCCCLVAHSGVILQLSDYYSLIPLIHSWNRDRRNSSLLNLSRHIEAALQRVRLLIKQCTHNHDKYYADNHRPLLPQQFQQYSRNTEAQDFYMSGVRMNKRYILSPRKLMVCVFSVSVAFTELTVKLTYLSRSRGIERHSRWDIFMKILKDLIDSWPHTGITRRKKRIIEIRKPDTYWSQLKPL